jgi:uncharacterized protein YbaR (Trm112 family)
MKEQVVTFKVDEDLFRFLNNIQNKSEFIRNSILKALDNCCPLCNGTGMLNLCQKNHWKRFREQHELVRCNDCKSVYLTCENK